MPAPLDPLTESALQAIEVDVAFYLKYTEDGHVLRDAAHYLQYVIASHRLVATHAITMAQQVQLLVLTNLFTAQEADQWARDAQVFLDLCKAPSAPHYTPAE